MAIDGRKLVNYLAHDISPGQVADALNITPARVSQLQQEPKIIEAIAQRRAQMKEENITDVADLKSIKKSLIGRMGDLVDSCESLGEAVRAMETIDKMTATKLGQDQDSHGIKQIIMQVPIFIQNISQGGHRVTLDSANRITAINDRSMAQMPTQGVLDILNGKGRDNGTGTDIEANYSSGKEAIELDLSSLQIG